MNDHDHGHDEREDVHEVVGGLEDERVRQHQRARVALGLDATAAGDVLVADQGTQRYRRLCAYRCEVAETHGGGGGVGRGRGRYGAENRRRCVGAWSDDEAEAARPGASEGARG